MADIKSQKKKAFFGLSLGSSLQGNIVDLKVSCNWKPGVSKFKKRSGKGHN